MKEGKLIVLEGLDGSGKFTQFDLLRKELSKSMTVKTMDFPQYDTYFGKQIGRYLRGEFGSLDEVPVEVPVVLYALDRYQGLDQLIKWIAKGYVVLLNRYTSSSMAFQGAKLKGKKRDELLDWIELLEYRLPKADLVLFLDVPRKIAEELVLKKAKRNYLSGEKRDIHEKNSSYQSDVEKMYKYLCKTRKNWLRIDCTKNGKLMTPNLISEKIVKKCKNLI